MTVEQLERCISSKELTEWMAYYRIEPFGQERDDYHSARIAAAVYNAFANAKVTESDFMLSTPGDGDGDEAPSRQMSQADLRKMADVVKRSFAGARNKG